MKFTDMIPGLGLLADIGGMFAGASAQRQANRTNIMLSREQRDFEKYMSNTAVRRRADDIEAAGGNRALAFTGGGEATTPTYTTARSEPIYKGDSNFTGKAIALMNARQIAAQTRLTNAQADSTEVEAKIRKSLMPQEQETRANRFVEEREWDDLRTELLRIQKGTTGLQYKQLSETIDSLIATAKQQQRAGKLDLDALENVARVGGLEGSKAIPFIKLILDFIRTTKD